MSVESARVVVPSKDESALVRSTSRRTAVVLALVVALIVVIVASVFVGSGDVTVRQTWLALTDPTGSTDDLLVRSFRVPRTLLGLLVGAALGLAGAVIQAITRNPLADPGILGVNAGAYFTVVVGTAFFGAAGINGQIWWSLIGAVVAAVTVYLIGAAGRSGGSPAKMVLAGVAVGSVLNGISYGITLVEPDVFDQVRLWRAGSLQGRQLDVVTGVLPFILAGIVLSILLARNLNALALGDDLARSLGTRVWWTRAFAFAAITLLCGAATAAAGPITFVGLMVPYVARAVVGPDQRWVLPLCLLIAPTIFLGSDILGRLLVTSEVPVGVVTAFIGAPLLIVLIRRTKAKGL